MSSPLDDDLRLTPTFWQDLCSMTRDVRKGNVSLVSAYSRNAISRDSDFYSSRHARIVQPLPHSHSDALSAGYKPVDR